MRKPISVAFNVAVNQVASRLFPCGFDVAEESPDLDGLRAHVAKTGRMVVWSGASDRTIFCDNETNYSFRAWHDWCHLKGNFPFNVEGEIGACAMQQNHVRKLYSGADADLFCKLLDIEVNGQLAYESQHGCFPKDQYAFTLAALA